jgi:hypothetical protein
MDVESVVLVHGDVLFDWQMASGQSVNGNGLTSESDRGGFGKETKVVAFPGRRRLIALRE